MQGNRRARQGDHASYALESMNRGHCPAKFHRELSNGKPWSSASTCSQPRPTLRFGCGCPSSAVTAIRSRRVRATGQARRVRINGLLGGSRTSRRPGAAGGQACKPYAARTFPPGTRRQATGWTVAAPRRASQDKVIGVAAGEPNGQIQAKSLDGHRWRWYRLERPGAVWPVLSVARLRAYGGDARAQALQAGRQAVPGFCFVSDGHPAVPGESWSPGRSA
jgi:hypothetical protein